MGESIIGCAAGAEGFGVVSPEEMDQVQGGVAFILGMVAGSLLMTGVVAITQEYKNNSVPLGRGLAGLKSAIK